MQEAKKSIQEALDNCVYINYDTSQLRIKVQNTLAALKTNPNYSLKLSSDKPIRLKDDPRDFKKHLKYIVWSAQQQLPKKSQMFKNMFRQFEKQDKVDVDLLQQELQIYKKLSETKDQNVTITFLQKQVFELTQQLQKQSEQLTKQKSENVCLSFKTAKLEASQKQKDVQFAQMQRQLQGKTVQHNLLLEDVKQREQLQLQLNEQKDKDQASALQQLRDQNTLLEKKLKAEIHELQNVIRSKDDQIKSQTLQFTAEKHLLTEQIEIMRKDNIKIREIQQEDQRTLQKMTIELDTKQQQVTQMKLNFNEQIQEYKNTINQLKKQPTQDAGNLKIQSRSSKREDSMLGMADNDPDQDIYTLTQQNQQLKYDFATKDQQCQKLAKEIQIRTQQLQKLSEQRKQLEEQVSHLRLELSESTKREAQYMSRDDAVMIQNQKQIIQNLQQEVKDLKNMLARAQNNEKNDSQQSLLAYQDTITPKLFLGTQQLSQIRPEEKQAKSPFLQDMTLLLSPQRQQKQNKMTTQELNHENNVLWSENQRLKAQLQKQRDMLVQKELEAGIQAMNTRAQQTRLAKNSFLKPILKAQDLPFTQINLPHKQPQNPQIKITQAKIIKAGEQSDSPNMLPVLGPVSSQENSETEQVEPAYKDVGSTNNQISVDSTSQQNEVEAKVEQSPAEVPTDTSGQNQTDQASGALKQPQNNVLAQETITQSDPEKATITAYAEINEGLIEAQTV